MRKLFILLMLLPSLVLAQPQNSGPLSAVLQAGNIAPDDQTILFGTSSDISVKYNSATEDLEIDNTLNDSGITAHITDIPLFLDITGVSPELATGAWLSYTEAGAAVSSGFNTGVGAFLTYSGSGSTGASLVGLGGQAQTTSADALTGVYGLYYNAYVSGDGNVTDLSGAHVVVDGNTAGFTNTITNMSAYTFDLFSSNAGTTYTNVSAITGDVALTATATNFHFLKVTDPTSGTITNNYGVYIPDWTRGTNDYAIYLVGNGVGNSITFDAGDSRIYDDNTDLVIDPEVTGSGVVSIGPTANKDMELDELGVCGTTVAGSTAIITGTCSGSKRGVLNFNYTKNGGTGIAANIASAMTYNLSGTNANVTGVNSALTTTVGGSGTNTFNALATTQATGTNFTTGTYQFRGLNVGAPTAPASSSGATIYQIGVQQRQFTAFPSASTEVIAGFVFEDHSLLTTGDRLYFEGTGGGSPAFGDSYLWYDNTDSDIELFVEGLQTIDSDDDLTQLGDVAAGNYLQIYNATSGTIPEGSWKGVGTGLYVVDGDTSAFAYSGDTDARLQFSTTNAFEFRDLGGVSRFNLDVLNGDLEVGTAARGIDMVTSGDNLTIGRLNAGSITQGALATTTTQTFQTTDPDITAYTWIVQTAGTDPDLKVEAARTTTTDATVTTILTIPITATSTTLIQCRIGGIRTGGVAGAAGDGADYVLRCSYRDNAGTTTERADTIDFTAEDVAGWTVSCAPSTTNALIQVTGAASTNITWNAWCEITDTVT